MALLQMQRIFIYALKKDRKKLLELMQRHGVIEINNLLKEDSIFHKDNISSARSRFERNINSASEALNILNTYVPYKKSLLSALYGRKELTVEAYDSFKDKYLSVIENAGNLISLSKKIAEGKAEILRIQASIEILSPWTSLDIPANYSGTKHTGSFIGSLPNEWTLEGVYEILSEHNPVNVDIISTSKNQTCIFVVCTKENENKVYDVLRANDFSQPTFLFNTSPSEQLNSLREQIKELEDEISRANDEIISYADIRDDLYFLQDYDTMRMDKYDVIGNLLQSNNTLIITGFIAQKDAEDIKKELEAQFDVMVEITDTKKRDDVPILFKNNGFCAPLEGTVAAFSPPGRGEMDPTMVMSLFYYMMFGLMLSDAGYGALITICCGFALIKYGRVMETSMKNTCRMFMFCGISTIIWGILFGSYFGDVIDIIAQTFFGYDKLPVIQPLWFFPVQKPMLMFTFSMALGIVHILTGLAMKGYQYARNKDIKSIIYDVVFWYVLLVGGLIILLSMKMVTNILGINVSIPSKAVDVSSILAILAAVGIILTNGRDSKNPFKRILKGLYALYGISGYLSDILSYSRLLALGLATGIIGSVINKMAAMTAGGIIGPVAFTLIVVVGHMMNLGINILGAYVHTNRLQYVEFFGKFYEGGGRLFNPFRVNTKYYKFKESIEHGDFK